MKKAVLTILLAFIITFSFSFAAGGVALAEEAQYAPNTVYRAPDDSSIPVFGLIGGTETLLFYIPATYYFKVVYIPSAADKFYVEYNGTTESSLYYIKATTGVALNSEVDVEPLGAFTLPLVLDSDSTLYRHYNNIEWNEIPLTASTNPEITFLGFSTYGTTLANAAYVKVGESYGFIDAAKLTVKDSDRTLMSYLNNIPVHPNYQPEEAPPPAGGGIGNIDNTKLTRIILIVGIVVPALIIMLLLFKPSKKNRYDYDRNRGFDSGNSPYDRPRSRYRDDYYEDDYRRSPPRGREDDYYDDYRDNRRY